MQKNKYILSVVVPIYNAAKYLKATLRTFEWQTAPSSAVEIILVDDGSTDGAFEICSAWAFGRPNVTVIKQPHKGVGAARNTALDIATGLWFASVDSDDLLDRNYFTEVLSIIKRDESEAASAISTRLLILDESSGRWHDKHMLGNKFRKGDLLVSMNENPNIFTLSSTTFLQTAVLHEKGLRYRQDLIPKFEDAHLIGRYLSYFKEPVMALASRALYFYRRRSSSDQSLTQMTWNQKENYTTTLQLGHLDMLEDIRSRLNYVPIWAQNMVLYDLMWYMCEEKSMNSKTAWLNKEVEIEFVELLEQIIKHIDISTIEKFPYRTLTWSMRQALLLRFKGGIIKHRFFSIAKKGTLARIECVHNSNTPDVSIVSNGKKCKAKIIRGCSHQYFGEEWMRETVFAWDTGTTEETYDEIWAGGVNVQTEEITEPSTKVLEDNDTSKYCLKQVSGWQRNTLLNRCRKMRRTVEIVGLSTRRRVLHVLGNILSIKRKKKLQAKLSQQKDREARRLISLAKSNAVRAKYANSWVIMDHANKADDNGEHLYRYIIKNRTDINAYFLLTKDSTDWERLQREGFRLVEYGSDEAALLVLNCVARISSDAVYECMYPISPKRYGNIPGVFIFLQHGVIKDDLSLWLNTKKIDMMVASTLEEYQSIVSLSSPYRLNHNEVALVGLARWDKLLSEQKEISQRNSILIMPTWRKALVDQLQEYDQLDERYIVFEKSDYGMSWLSLIRSKSLENLDKEIKLIFHPRINELVPNLDLPDNVVQISGKNLNYQRELACAALVLTDYSAIAFDAGYIRVPVIYYQFDYSSFFSVHSYREGYYSYEEDGFGPIAISEGDVIDKIIDLSKNSYRVDERYLSRMKNAFKYNDSRNCLRTVMEIEKRLL